VEKRTVRPHTYNEVFETSYNLGRFIHSRQLFYVEELQKLKFIGIYSKNRYEWFLTDWACILFGITTIPLYETLGV
jgi:long-subunit acyl-CoA synthetase (AMP-forming)